MAISIKTIAKNSVYLYIRMVITMLIALYSSRIVLHVLDVDGFGTYNVIYGIVVFFLFLQSSLNTTTLRFISKSIATCTESEQAKVFNTLLHTTIILIVVVFILLETLGAYIATHVLNIGEEYRDAIIPCFQICIVTFIVQTIRIPYTSLIVSHEKMSFYALISIIESVLKLLAAFLLFLSDSNRLLLYCICFCGSALSSTVLTYLYCKKNFGFYRLKKRVDYKEVKHTMTFSGWASLSSFSNAAAQQGGNILMNVFTGVVANASWGIAHQANTAFSSLASSLQMAFTPQINKSYAERDYKGLSTLINRSSSIAFYMVTLVGVPIMCNIHFVLDIWLVTPPAYAYAFCVLIIIFQLIDTLQSPFNSLIFASNRIKEYNIWLSSILIMNIVISSILLSKGVSPICVPATMVVLNTITGILRLIHIKYFMDIDLSVFFKRNLPKMLAVLVLSIIVSLLFNRFSLNVRLNCFFSTGMSFIITFGIIWLLGLSKNERKEIIRIVKAKIK